MSQKQECLLCTAKWGRVPGGSGAYVVQVEEELPAGDLGPELDARKVGSTQLPVQRIGLLWRCSQAVAQHDCTQVLHSSGESPVRGKVIYALRGKGRPHNIAGLCVSVQHDSGLIACMHAHA